MDYGRIDKPQKGGVLSPGKLRTLLMGLEKKRKQEEEEELESHSSLRSHNDDSGCYSSSDTCKDVDVVTELRECSSLTKVESDILANGKPNSSRMRPQEECEIVDYDGMMSSSAFEFQKTERGPQKVPAAPFSKPAPSKWDDAQKWIASPTSNRPKTGARKASNAFGHGKRQLSLKNVELMDQRSVVSEEPHTIRMDPRQGKKENGAQNCDGSESQLYPPGDLYGQPVAVVEKSFGIPAISLSQHDSYQTATSFMPPPSMARSISMRDMGTEMTPVASQEPSRNGTPVKVTSPLHSPISSQPSSPKRNSPSAIHANSRDLNRKDLSEKEMQLKTRREIMVLGTKLGKTNIAAWASKEEEDKDAADSLKNMGAAEQVLKNVMEKRAETWEEAEKAKYMARFEREEMKILAWENLQKAKAEAEMRKFEVEIERRKAQVQDRLMNELTAARQKAEAKREAAEVKKNKKATKTEQQAEYIRKTGQIPSNKFSCCGCCL